MGLALAEARRALDTGDVPIGAVVLGPDGGVLGVGRNEREARGDPTAHAEMVAIRRFLAAEGIEKLKGATLYSSGESCPMCMGAIVWCGIARVVYGASIAQLAPTRRRSPTSRSPAGCWRKSP
jgi:tRNA(Arg) A34 adenosine deaminase TadA